MKPDWELKLQAWLDAELPAAEAEQVRRRIAADPEAARLLAELRQVKAAFRDHEQPVAVPETRPFYWSKIERQIQREAAVRPSPGVAWAERFRRWLAPLAGVAALAAVLLVALNQSAPPAIMLNQVSDTADGFKALTFRDNSAGINFVVLQETPQPSAALAAALPARTRYDGSSFMIESE
jgi:anti-sigma factor RsiW